MNLETFKLRVINHGLVLLSQGLTTSFVDIILWDCEWHHKWAEAMKGRCDA